MKFGTLVIGSDRYGVTDEDALCIVTKMYSVDDDFDEWEINTRKHRDEDLNLYEEIEEN